MYFNYKYHVALNLIQIRQIIYKTTRKQTKNDFELVKHFSIYPGENLEITNMCLNFFPKMGVTLKHIDKFYKIYSIAQLKTNYYNIYYVSWPWFSLQGTVPVL